MLARFNGFSVGARLVIGLAVILLVVGVAVSSLQSLRNAIFGNPEVIRQQGETIIAEEQGNAARNAGISAGQKIVERYEYHRVVDRLVAEGQGGVNDAWNGESVGKDVDTAGRAALCGLHDSYCQRPGAAAL